MCGESQKISRDLPLKGQRRKYQRRVEHSETKLRVSVRKVFFLFAYFLQVVETEGMKRLLKLIGQGSYCPSNYYYLRSSSSTRTAML